MTSGLHDLEPGDAVGLRGPLGNGYPPPATCFRAGMFSLSGAVSGFSTLRSLTGTPSTP